MGTEFRDRESISLWCEDGIWIIEHTQMGVVTQSSSRLTALLMLADALSVFTDDDEDLMKAAERIFG